MKALFLFGLLSANSFSSDSGKLPVQDKDGSGVGDRIGDASCSCDGSGGLTVSGSGYAGCISEYSEVRSLVVLDYISSIPSCRNWHFLESVKLPSSLTSMESSQFEYCYDLVSVRLECRILGDYMFRYCYRLTSITIADGVSVLPVRIFYGCESLSGVTLPQTLREIEGYSFYGCYSLKELAIPSGVQVIRESAFSNATGLESLSIGSQCSVDQTIFTGCSSLVSIHLIGVGHHSSLCSALDYFGFPRSHDVVLYVDYESGDICGRHPKRFQSVKLNGWQIGVICLSIVTVCNLVIVIILLIQKMRNRKPPDSVVSTSLEMQIQQDLPSSFAIKHYLAAF
jgi:hypothetical protein